MKKTLIEELKPGMCLAKDVCMKDGRLLLLTGFTIKPRYIQKLKILNIPYVYVKEEHFTPPEELSEEKIYSEAFSSIQNVMTAVRDGKGLDITSVRDTVNEIVPRILNNEYVFMQVTGIRDIDSYTFLHSVDVCIYSVITGKNMGLGQNDLVDLGIGAILHDIGKCKTPLEILLKPGRLTDDEFHIMKLHTIHGYEIISNTEGLSKRVANIACQHHEKWDGTGYPLGLSGYHIDKMARIVTAADIYDALTADRIYKKRDLPHEAAEYIVANSSILLDPEVACELIKNIAIYPVGSIVLLNTGEIGSVVEKKGHVSIRPVVRVIARKDGPPILTPYDIDLFKNLDVFIVDLLT